MISIPGLNQWVKERNTNVEQPDTSTTHDNSIGKRSLNDRDDNGTEEMDCSEPITKKEKILGDSDLNSDGDYSTKVQSIVSEDHILNFPIPIEGGKACIVKVIKGYRNILEIIYFLQILTADFSLSKI